MSDVAAIIFPVARRRQLFSSSSSSSNEHTHSRSRSSSRQLIGNTDPPTRAPTASPTEAPSSAVPTEIPTEAPTFPPTGIIVSVTWTGEIFISIDMVSITIQYNNVQYLLSNNAHSINLNVMRLDSGKRNLSNPIPMVVNVLRKVQNLCCCFINRLDC